jgi:hypothetical protein
VPIYQEIDFLNSPPGMTALYPSKREMASRDFHRVLKDVQAWLGSIVGSGDGYASTVRRRVLRQWALALAAVVGFVAIGVGGYAIGASQVRDADTAHQAGMTAGEQRGTAVGVREGYASAFRPARQRAYDAAYHEAYRTAYRDAFETADLAAPRRVKVSGP